MDYLVRSGRKTPGAGLTSELSRSQPTLVVLPLALRPYTAVPGGSYITIKSHHLGVSPVPGLVLSFVQVG